MRTATAVLALALFTACSQSAPATAPPPVPAPAPAPVAPVIDPGFTNLPAAPPNPEVRKALFAEFQPVALANCKFERIGNANDGGYLACANLLGNVQSGYSYGIANEDSLGCDISVRLKVPVHQYDCFDTREPACPGGKTVFHAECVAPRRGTEEGRLFDTVQSQVAKNGDTGKRLFMKMDVEGAEWASLAAAPDELLAQIDQLAMEFHHVDAPVNLDAIRKLKKHFYLVNIHYNNYSCDPKVEPFPAWAFQALLVNKRLGVLAPEGTIVGPNPLDKPDDPQRADCQPAPAATGSKSPR
jgi:hypothetical protein